MTMRRRLAAIGVLVLFGVAVGLAGVEVVLRMDGKKPRHAERLSREPVEERQAQAVVADCMKQGVIIGATNRSIAGFNNTLCLSPALIARPDDIDAITEAIDGALGRVFG